jgi:UDP-GlcNAc:undecaprenyl-phosphate/decaprenyl-phosphate GlcNAc-1-phosphate transferase
MSQLAIAASASFAVTVAAVPLVRLFCERMEILDRPGPLKIHARPTPRMGGVAVFLGLIVGIFVSGYGHGIGVYFLSALSLVWLIGAIDDFRGVHPLWRLLVQFAAASILWRDGLRPPVFTSGPAAFAALSLIVIFYINAFNLIDGSDGLAAGLALIAAVSFAALPQNAMPPSDFAVALSTAAACAAFLPYNWHPASTFLGDSGSTMLGFVCAFLALRFTSSAGAPAHYALFPLVVAVLPLCDAARVIALRLAACQSPLFGDRSHYYDVLLSRGWAPREVALISWAVAAAAAALAVLIVRTNRAEIWDILILAIVTAWIASVSRTREIARHERLGKGEVSASL